jgi:hypothetical protein
MMGADIRMGGWEILLPLINNLEKMRIDLAVMSYSAK